MTSLRKLLPVLLVGALSVAFAGVSAALDGGNLPGTDEPTTTVDTTGSDASCPPPATAVATDATDATDGCEAPEVDEPEADDPAECDSTTTDGTVDPTDGTTDGATTDGVTPDAAVCDPAPTPDPTEGDTPATHPDNHGAAVSQAAHDCPAGPGHGACVRAVAQSDAGKPTKGTDTTDSTDSSAAGSRAAHGKGAGKAKHTAG